MIDLATSLVSIAFDGLAYGMILFIISVGLSITLGLMNFANLAHGAFAMLGGYLCYSLANQLGVPFLLAVVIAFFAVGAISVPFERYLYRRLYGESDLVQVLLTIGLAFMFIAVCTRIWGSANLQMAVPGYLKGQIDLGFRSFPTYRTLLIAVSFLIALGLWLGIERTRMGAQIRAAVDNRRMAQSVGINVDLLFTLTFALGSGLAAVGGALGTEIVGLTPFYAIEFLVFFLIVVSVGGQGNLKGAFFAALIIGIIDTAIKYRWSHVSSFFIYLLTIGALLWRPRGLFGGRG
jgi:branched-chain amino acid transport system permease protein